MQQMQYDVMKSGARDFKSDLKVTDKICENLTYSDILHTDL